MREERGEAQFVQVRGVKTAHLFEVVAVKQGERQVQVGAPEPVVRGRLLVQHPLALVLTQRVHRCALGCYLLAFSRQELQNQYDTLEEIICAYELDLDEFGCDGFNF